MGVESYKHQFAKTTLANWFREVSEYDEYCDIDPIRWRVNRGGPNFGIWTEYPICIDKRNDLVGYSAWDEAHWMGQDFITEGVEFTSRPPTYEEVISFGLLPIAIFDVAIQHKGHIVYGIEVVHRHGISEIKQDYLNRIQIPVYTIDADWILSRVKRPLKLECRRVY